MKETNRMPQTADAPPQTWVRLTGRATPLTKEAKHRYQIRRRKNGSWVGRCPACNVLYDNQRLAGQAVVARIEAHLVRDHAAAAEEQTEKIAAVARAMIEVAAAEAAAGEAFPEHHEGAETMPDDNPRITACATARAQLEEAQTLLWAMVNGLEAAGLVAIAAEIAPHIEYLQRSSKHAAILLSQIAGIPDPRYRDDVPPPPPPAVPLRPEPR